MSRPDDRIYLRSESAVFYKTRERFGALSNMAPGYPLKINGAAIPSSEALYQACRYPHRPDIQKAIIAQRSPMTAKMKSKKHYPESRPDWDKVRVAVMRWCLRVKLMQHFEFFERQLRVTGERPIVEQSRRDRYWGAVPIDSETLVGRNVLGRLLMELRDQVRSRPESALTVAPPPIPDFLLNNQPIDHMGRAPAISEAMSTGPLETLDLFPSIGEMQEPQDLPVSEELRIEDEMTVEEVAALLAAVAERLNHETAETRVRVSLHILGTASAGTWSAIKHLMKARPFDTAVEHWDLPP